MEEREILIETLREDYQTPTEDQIVRLDADLTLLAHILVDYFIQQKRCGKKISDPYADSETQHESNNLRSSVRPQSNRGHQP